MDSRERAFDPFDGTFDQGTMIGLIGGDGGEPVRCEWRVCDVCNGSGTHVNPDIDSNGITADEMDELGDEFRENYVSGRYDVTCNACHGRRVVPTPIVTDPNKRRFEQYVRDHYAYLAEREAEMRMGA